MADQTSDLSDEDYRAIARAARSITVVATVSRRGDLYRVFDERIGQFVQGCGDDLKAARDWADAEGGRAAVAEYEKRRAKR